jgi:LEA14-like dessication related protein
MPKPIPIPISGMQAAIITNPRKKSPGEYLSLGDIPLMTRKIASKAKVLIKTKIRTDKLQQII